MRHFWLDINIISEQLVRRLMEGGLCDLLLFVWMMFRPPLKRVWCNGKINFCVGTVMIDENA